MPPKDWIQPLGEGFYLLIDRTTEAGIISKFRVVLFYKDACISRYDSAHGRAHRDIIGKESGWIDFVECKDMPYNKVFEAALRDYENNHQAYLDFYLQH